MDSNDWSDLSAERLSLTNFLSQQFDDKFGTITKNGKSIPFSVNRILQDLYNSGLEPMQAFEILDEIYPHLFPEIDNKKIIRLINQAFQQLGWGESYGKRNFLQPIIIDYPNGRSEVFNYQVIRDFLKTRLSAYSVTSKTFKVLIDELYRVLLSLRSDRVNIDVVENMLPSVLRNIIGTNPFSSKRLEADYYLIVKLSSSLMNTWHYLPREERRTSVISLFESFYRIILLHHNYLPGFNLRSTLSHVSQLLADMMESASTSIGDKEMYFLSHTQRKIVKLLDNQNELVQDHWLEYIETIRAISENLVENGTINWLIVTDQSGTEIYSRFISEKDSRHKSLLGMAISGVQSLVNELTDKRITQIDQDEGCILIERHDLFSIVAMVETATPKIRQCLSQLSKFIQSDLKKTLEDFNGDVSNFVKLIDEYLDNHYKELFQQIN